MSQLTTLSQVETAPLAQLESENAELQRYLAAQKRVIASLERRVGRSLEDLGVHLEQLTSPGIEEQSWHRHLASMQNEVDCLCDLLADATLLQKLEAGRVELNLEAIDLQELVTTATRHLLEPRQGVAGRLVCQVAPLLPLAWIDQELTEAVLLDLLGRSLKYSDPDSPVVLDVELAPNQQICLNVTAQRFAPVGNREFATEIALCCRRIEVQQGTIACQQGPDGLQIVKIELPTLQAPK